MQSRKKNATETMSQSSANAVHLNKELEGNKIQVRGTHFNTNEVHSIQDQRNQTSTIHDNRAPIQAFFDISGYRQAIDNWTAAYNAVNQFDGGMDVIEGRAENQEIENDGVLKANVAAKGHKAATTISGEAFEVHEWSAPFDANHVIGPGGVAGADLKRYNVAYGALDPEEIVDEGIDYESARLGAPAQHGEVKSTINVHTFNTGVSSAVGHGQDTVIMYAAAGNVPAANDTFHRGDSYFIYRANGTGGADYKATITVKNRTNGAAITTLEIHEDPQ